MIAVIDAQLAWCPPTFRPSLLSRTWLAWWMVQALSQRSRSSSVFSASMSVVTGLRIAPPYPDSYGPNPLLRGRDGSPDVIGQFGGQQQGDGCRHGQHDGTGAEVSRRVREAAPQDRHQECAELGEGVDGSAAKSKHAAMEAVGPGA